LAGNLVFKFHKAINWTDASYDDPGLNVATNKYEEDTLNLVTWNVYGISFQGDQLEDQFVKKNIT
jgi:hypothetical protein